METDSAVQNHSESRMKALRNTWIIAGLVLGLVGVAIDRALVSQNVSDQRDFNMLALYLPSPPSVVEHALGMAQVGSNDLVYDLGSGDGRVLVEAAQKFHARAIGIELNYGLVAHSRAKIRALGLESQVEVLWGDILKHDLSPATVVFLFLPTESNRALRPKLERELRPHTRVISHNSPIEGWEPVSVEVLRDPDNRDTPHTIYLYRR